MYLGFSPGNLETKSTAIKNSCREDCMPVTRTALMIKVRITILLILHQLSPQLGEDPPVEDLGLCDPPGEPGWLSW